MDFKRLKKPHAQIHLFFCAYVFRVRRFQMRLRIFMRSHMFVRSVVRSLVRSSVRTLVRCMVRNACQNASNDVIVSLFRSVTSIKDYLEFIHIHQFDSRSVRPSNLLNFRSNTRGRIVDRRVFFLSFIKASRRL